MTAAAIAQLPADPRYLANAYLRDNFAVASLTLPEYVVAELDAIGRESGRPVGEHRVEQTGKALVEFGAVQRVDHLTSGLRRLDQPCRTQRLQMVGQRALRNGLARRGIGTAQPIGIGERVQRKIERNVLQPGMGEAGHETDVEHRDQFIVRYH